MSPPLAYFLTWTTYGAWLHGDERGSVDDEHNRFGTPVLGADEHRARRERERMRGEPLLLSEPMREIVDSTMREHAGIRQWDLLALNVRTNHVHVVVRCHGRVSPEKVMGEFKLWCSRRLREGGLVSVERPVWTEHGSTRWINHGQGLAAAIEYVMNGQ